MIEIKLNNDNLLLEIYNFNNLNETFINNITFLKISNTDINIIPNIFINLKELHLNNCNIIKEIPNYCNLKKLYLYNCNNIIEIPNTLLNLQELNIQYCVNFKYLRNKK